MKGFQRGFRALVLVSVLSVTALAGCGSGGSDTGAGELRVFNWGEYLDPAVIEGFEEETGIKVIYEEFETNEVMYAKLAQDPSAYDVLCPSDYMISKLIEQDMLSELDMEKIPNARENIGDAYWEQSEGFDPGNKYSVPYCWGTVGILYNKTMVDEPIDSWKVLWDERYSGNILMQNSVRDAFMIPLMMKGYSMNTVNEAEIAEAAQMLIDQKPLVQAYVVDQVRDKMIGDEAAIGVIYSGEAIYTQRENENLEYVIPKEGTNLWIDSWVVTNGAKNMENAHAWIDYMCRPESALANFDFITYSTPNTVARELIEDEAIRNSEIAYPDLSKYKLDVYVNLGEEADNMYNEYWMKVKSE
ncbi:MAG: ABC transporter substrate-binding protein [Lachnospiraceae bacterium]|nr:ABC transporter substrate-binding protein [Lachnospiraceae bacterium]